MSTGRRRRVMLESDDEDDVSVHVYADDPPIFYFKHLNLNFGGSICSTFVSFACLPYVETLPDIIGCTLAVLVGMVQCHKGLLHVT